MWNKIKHSVRLKDFICLKSVKMYFSGIITIQTIFDNSKVYNFSITASL